MNACRFGTGSEPGRGPGSDGVAFGLLALERDRGGTGSDDGSAIPIEIVPELTSPYPIGLCDDLCGLSCCRPRAA